MGFVKLQDTLDIGMLQGKFRLTGNLEARLASLTIPGATFTKERAVLVPATAFTANELAVKLEKYVIKGCEEYTDLLDSYRNIESIKEDGLTEWPSKTARWKHQTLALNFGLQLKNFGLFMEMGTGKTKVVIDLIDIRKPSRVLVIAPKSVVVSEVWSSEFKKHAINKYDVVELIGSNKERAETLDILNRKKRPFIVVTNYESIWRGELSQKAKESMFDFIVLDEAHKIKSTKTTANKFLTLFGRTIKYRIAMTGTPLADKPADVFGIYKFLDPAIFGTNFQQFANLYIDMGGYMGRQTTSYHNLAELQRKMYSIGFRVSKDVLDLPETMTIHREFEMNSEARQRYREIDRDLATDVNGEKFLIQNSLVKIVRLQQLTSGYLPSNDAENPLHRIDDGKKELLREILEELADDEPVVIFCKFLRDLQVIKEVSADLKREYKELSGSKKQNLEWSRGLGTILGVQINSGSAGIDLTRASTAIYYSIGHSLTNYEQSFSRVHRPGQKKNVKFIHLLAKNTIDYEVLRAVLDKKDIVDAIVDSIKVRSRDHLPKALHHLQVKDNGYAFKGSPTFQFGE